MAAEPSLASLGRISVRETLRTSTNSTTVKASGSIARRGWRAIAAVATAIAVTAGTFSFGWWGGAAAMPAEGSADAGFLRDIIVRHDQAVAMSFQ